MKKKDVKDYIRKQVKKEIDKALQTPGKVTNFTINLKPLDTNLLKIPTMKDLEPSDRTISFVIKSEINKVPSYMTLTGCKFTSYNRPHFREDNPEYVTTSVSVNPKGWTRKKDKPKFTTAQKRSMR